MTTLSRPGSPMAGNAGREGLVIQDLSKAYEGVWALSQVSLSVLPGQVVALAGHNGAGKSTLLRSLSGAERPDSGAIVLDGVRRNFARPSDAAAAGIACVYQELSLIEELTVAENLFLGQERTHGGRLERRKMNATADELCDEFGIHARATDPVSALPVAQKQMVEVIRAVRRGSRYLLLDEPTTALEPAQIDHLLTIVRTLTREKNLGVLFVDHKLDEVFAVADYIVALSNGRLVLDGPVATVDRAAVVRAVVGEHPADDAVGEGEQARPAAAGEPDQDPARASQAPAAEPTVLAARNVRGPGLTDVSLQVHEGEILGVYGLVGSGRTRFLRTVYGAEPMTSGTLTLHGRGFAPKRPGRAVKAGVAFVSEERKHDGLIPQLSARVNVVIPVLDRFRRLGILNWPGLGQSADEVLATVGIRGDTRMPVSSLSGGNQQKALFARATLQAPRLLLLDEPTKGVDIGAKAEIYSIVHALAREKGVAVIVVSSEEEEILTLADRVTIFRLGTCDGTTHETAGLTIAKLRQLAWSDADELAHST
jgi:ABC-type sugar transport system ATPase subunit